MDGDGGETLENIAKTAGFLAKLGDNLERLLVVMEKLDGHLAQLEKVDKDIEKVLSFISTNQDTLLRLCKVLEKSNKNLEEALRVFSKLGEQLEEKTEAG